MKTTMRGGIALGVAALGMFLAGSCAWAQAVAPTSTLADDLKTHYKLAKVGADSQGYMITEAGTVLVIQKGGILGVPPSNPVMPPSTYKDGDLRGPSAGAKMFAGNDTKLLEINEMVYVIRLDVNPKTDRVQLVIVECDVCNRVTRPSMYKAVVVFQYPKGYLDSADAGQVADVISQVLAPVQQQQAQDPAPPPPQAAPAAPAPSPAPTPAPAAAPATVQLGMTPPQVQAAFGQPLRIFNGGAKQIYFYKDFKVTFMNGKVTDVE